MTAQVGSVRLPCRRKTSAGREWRMRDCVYVGPGSVWANPFRVRPSFRPYDVVLYVVEIHLGDRAGVVGAFPRQCDAELFAVVKFRELMEGASLHLLAGLDLVCPCEAAACHADVLLELANREVSNVR